MKFLTQLDRGFEKVVRFIMSLTMAALMIFINVLILMRYVFRISLGGAEELPTYFFIICVWMAATLVTKNEEHVNLDLVFLGVKNPKIKEALLLLCNVLPGVAMGWFTKLFYTFFVDSFTRNECTPGLGFPYWWAHIFVLIGSAVMTIYFIRNAIVHLRRMFQ